MAFIVKMKLRIKIMVAEKNVRNELNNIDNLEDW